MKNPAEIEWVNELCGFCHPPCKILFPYPPSGDPNAHEIDTIIGPVSRTGGGPIAVETTLCYRGSRAEGEARLEERVLSGLSAWLREIAADHVDTKSTSVAFRIYFLDRFASLRDRIYHWLHDGGSGPSRLVLAQAGGEALRKSLASGMAEAIEFSIAWPEGYPLISDTGNQVYVRKGSSSPAVDWTFDFFEKHGSNWRRVITQDYGISLDAIEAAIEDKRAKLGKYRAIALQYHASQVWLLLVAEYVLGLDLYRALHDEDSLSPMMKREPQFDEIHLLAGGSWPPDDPKLSEYGDGPSWKDIRLWPPR